MMLDMWGERGKFFCSGQLERKLNFVQIGLTFALWLAAGWLFRRALFAQKAQEFDSGLLADHGRNHTFQKRKIACIGVQKTKCVNLYICRWNGTESWTCHSKVAMRAPSAYIFCSSCFWNNHWTRFCSLIHSSGVVSVASLPSLWFRGQ